MISLLVPTYREKSNIQQLVDRASGGSKIGPRQVRRSYQTGGALLGLVDLVTALAALGR